MGLANHVDAERAQGLTNGGRWCGLASGNLQLDNGLDGFGSSAFGGSHVVSEVDRVNK
jgi:hypothetical protein